MLAFLNLVLAAPPVPMSAAEMVSEATVVAEAEAIRTELQTLPEGAAIAVPVPWTEYRVVRPLRGTTKGEVYRLRPNEYCAPGPGPRYRRTGEEVVNVDRNTPVDLDEYLKNEAGGPRRVWLMLRPSGEEMVPVRWILDATPENTAIITAEVTAPGTEKAKSTFW